jgi:hypothetical protein
MDAEFALPNPAPESTPCSHADSSIICRLMQDHSTVKRITKRFTLAEANAMLPLVRSITSDISHSFKRVTGRRSDLHRLLRRGSKSTGSFYEDEIAESRADLQEEYDQIWKFREELESLGVVLKKPEDGIIEFPAILHGRSCYLCWQLGDEQISYYRDAAANSAVQRLPSHLENNAN